MNNNQALGYATISLYNILKRKGLEFTEIQEKIQELRDEMYWQFDEKTETEAEQIGNIIKYAENLEDLKKRLNNYRENQPVRVIKAERVE